MARTRKICIEVAALFVSSHALKSYNAAKCGYCARAVRRGLEAGGFVVSPIPPSAKDYPATLAALGFQRIDPTSPPLIGDITICPAIPHHPHGHISMYCGKSWVSDFVQSDCFGGAAYRANGVALRFRYKESVSSHQFS